MLAHLIRLADAAYRVGTPLMPDAWFDRLSRMAPDALGPIPTPLLGLDCPADPDDWIARHASEPLTLQLKADGVSVNLIYIDGVFASAHLRSGRDCTDAALRAGALPDLPGMPPGRVEIRCEAIGRPTAEQPSHPTTTPLSSQAPTPPTRNAVAAALRRPGLDDPTPLCLLAFNITGVDTLTTHTQALTWLACAGFATLPAVPVDPRDLPVLLLTFCSLRPSLPFPCDGLVITIDSRATQHRLGSTPRAPRWAISLKP